MATLRSIDFTKQPSWNRSKDIPAAGGIADKSCVKDVEIYAYYDDGRSVDISNIATITGSLVVPASTQTTRHAAGTLTINATYSDGGVTCNDDTQVTVYQAGASAVVTSIVLSLNPIGVVPSSGGATSNYVSYNVMAHMSDGTTQDVTSSASVTFTPSSIGQNISTTSKSINVLGTASYSGLTDTETCILTQSGYTPITVVSVSLSSVSNGTLVPQSGSSNLSSFVTNSAIATMSDGTTQDVTSQCTFTYNPSSIGANTSTSIVSHNVVVTATYTPDVTKQSSVNVTLQQSASGAPTIYSINLNSVANGTKVPQAGSSSLGNFVINTVEGVLADGSKIDVTANCTFTYTPSVIGANTTVGDKQHYVVIKAIYTPDTTKVDDDAILLVQEGASAPSLVGINLTSTPNGNQIPQSGSSNLSSFVTNSVIGTFSDGTTADVTSLCSFVYNPSTIGPNTSGSTVSHFVTIKAIYNLDTTITDSFAVMLQQTSGVPTVVSVAIISTPSSTNIPGNGTNDLTPYVTTQAIATMSDGTTQDVTSQCTISYNPSTIPANTTGAPLTQNVQVTATYNPDPSKTNTTTVSLTQDVATAKTPQSLAFTQQPVWDATKDVSARGGVADINNLKDYIVTVTYTDGTTADVTSTATYSGSISVPSTSVTTRHTCGQLQVSASYTENGVTVNATANRVYAYQKPYSPVVSLDYIRFTTQPTWDATKDIPAAGGTADKTCVNTYVITAYYTDGTTADVTLLSTVSGSKAVPASTVTTRHTAGTFQLVASYTEGTITVTDTSANIDIYQQAYSSRVLKSIAFTTQPVWDDTKDIHYRGGEADSYNTKNYVVTATYDDGTTADVTSACNMEGDVVVSASSITNRHTNGKIIIGAIYTENGVTCSAIANEIDVYQMGFATKNLVSIAFDPAPKWNDRLDISMNGGEANIDNMEDFKVIAYYDDGTSADVTDLVTATGSLTVPATTNPNRAQVGTLAPTVSYTENGVTQTTTAPAVPVYQEGYTTSKTPDHIEFYRNPTWDESKDIPAGGGTATIANCKDAKVILYYSDGTTADVTSDCVSDGSLNVPSSVVTNRHACGVLNVTETYTNGSFSSTVSANVTAFQAAYTVAFDVTPTSLSFVTAGEMHQLTVLSTGNWTVTTGDTWVTVDKTTGTGNGTIDVTLPINPRRTDRNSTVIVSDGINVATITITQAANSAPIVTSISITANPTTTDGDVPAGGTDNLDEYIEKKAIATLPDGSTEDVTDICTFIIEPSAIPANEDGEPHSYPIVVTGTLSTDPTKTGTDTVTLKTDGFDINKVSAISVQKSVWNNLLIPVSGTSNVADYITEVAMATVTGDNDQHALNPADCVWVYSPMTISANTTGAEKSISVTLTGSYTTTSGTVLTDSIVLTLKQGITGTYTVSPTTLTFPKAGSTQTITLTAVGTDCGTPVATVSGTGFSIDTTTLPNTISVTAAASSETKRRYGCVSILTNSGNIVVSLIQETDVPATLVSVDAIIDDITNIPREGIDDVSELIKDKVIGTYSDETTKDITDDCTIVYSPLTIPPYSPTEPGPHTITVTITPKEDPTKAITKTITLNYNDPYDLSTLSSIDASKSHANDLLVPGIGTTNVSDYITPIVEGIFSGSTTPENITNDCTITYSPTTIPANTTAAEKVVPVTMTATCNGKTSTVVVYVTQSPAGVGVFTATPSPLTFTSDGGNKNVTLTLGSGITSWTGVIDGTGFSADVLSGTASGTIVVTAAANHTPNVIYGSLTLESIGGIIRIPITQAAEVLPTNPPYYIGMTCDSANTLSVTSSLDTFPELYYAYSVSGTWTKLKATDTITFGDTATNKTLYVCGMNAVSTSATKNYKFIFGNASDVTLVGNAQGLIDYKNLTTSVPAFAFYNLFMGAPIVSVDDNFLPATTLANNCYQKMFMDTKISTVKYPLLPALVLAPYCYSYMFANS